MFYAVHGPKAHLRSLVSIPRSKSSYMIFMCAPSLHICEKCFGQTRYNMGDLSHLPLPIPVLLPRRSTDAIKYVGERFDPSWTIRMCLPCRQGHIKDFEEPFPRNTANYPMSLANLRRKYPCASSTMGLCSLGDSSISELVAINCMRQRLGGDSGIEAFRVSTEAWDDRTEARIRWYQLQE